MWTRDEAELPGPGNSSRLLPIDLLLLPAPDAVLRAGHVMVPRSQRFLAVETQGDFAVRHCCDLLGEKPTPAAFRETHDMILTAS